MPSLTGSLRVANTIGIVDVAFFAASTVTAAPPTAIIATEREIVAAQQIDAGCRGDKKLAVSELEKAIAIAEAATGLHQPRPGKDAQGQATVQGGGWRHFGEWFDRWVSCLKELAKYQSPQIKPIDAPTPPPDPADLERKAIKRFGLRIFDGGRIVQPLAAPSGREE